MGRPRKTGPRPASGGVLLIQNCFSGHTLVASSQNIRKRLSDHRRALQRGKHWNHRLQRDYNWHGSKAFFITIVDDGLYSMLLIREMKKKLVERLKKLSLAYNR